MKKTIRLSESELVSLVQRVITEQEAAIELGNIKDTFVGAPLYSDKENTTFNVTASFSDVNKNDDGSVSLILRSYKTKTPSFAGSGYRHLVFKCGVEGLLSVGNNTRVYNKKLEAALSKIVCGK